MVPVEVGLVWWWWCWYWEAGECPPDLVRITHLGAVVLHPQPLNVSLESSLHEGRHFLLEDVQGTQQQESAILLKRETQCRGGAFAVRGNLLGVRPGQDLPLTTASVHRRQTPPTASHFLLAGNVRSSLEKTEKAVAVVGGSDPAARKEARPSGECDEERPQTDGFRDRFVAGGGCLRGTAVGVERVNLDVVHHKRPVHQQARERCEAHAPRTDHEQRNDSRHAGEARPVSVVQT